MCACEHEATYKAIIEVFEMHWTVRDLGIVDTFFGLHFVSSRDCITIDQTKKTDTIIEEGFGPTWKSQHPAASCSIPMKTGTAHAKSLARALPLDKLGIAQVKAKYGFEF
jgi:hypothetical protein